MTTTLTNPLEEDTLNQARAEAREILKNSEETTIELTVSGRESPAAWRCPQPGHSARPACPG